MKFNTKLLIIGAILLSGLGYIFTHSDTFVSSVYEKAMVRECKTDLMCRLGAGLIEAPVVACMEDKTLSWTQTTPKNCLNEVTQSIKNNH